MKLSIIIPVYNVEKYIEKCIESIITQEECSDIEVLLIDDGSNDNSGQICDFYAQKDRRIIVIHQKNKGLPAARNTGITYATGEYIMFIDSDDYLLKNDFISKIQSYINNTNSDVIIYGCKRIYDKTNEIIEEAYKGLNKINHIDEKNRIKWLIENDKFAASAWMHIIKMSYLKKYNLLFDESFKTGEDLEWIFRVMINNPVIVGMDNTDYIYRIRENSICTNAKQTGFWEYRYEAIKRNVELIKNDNLENYINKPLLSYAAYLYYVLIGELIDEPDYEVRDNAFKLVEKYKWLSKYSYGNKNKICKILVSAFGIKNAARIMNFKMKLKRKY